MKRMFKTDTHTNGELNYIHIKVSSNKRKIKEVKANTWCIREFNHILSFRKFINNFTIYLLDNLCK